MPSSVDIIRQRLRSVAQDASGRVEAREGTILLGMQLLSVEIVGQKYVDSCILEFSEVIQTFRRRYQPELSSLASPSRRSAHTHSLYRP